MSGYSDDRDRDRDYDDRDDRDDRRGGRDDRDIREAKSRVMAPAVGLMVVAAFGFLSVIGGIIQYPGLDAAFDEQVKQIEANPQFTDAQKKEQVQLMNQIRDGMKVGWLPFYGMIGLFSIITFIGGFKLMNLSSPGLVTFASILSLLPCTSGCCVLGLVFGIWALVAMNKPEVKAGFAAKRRQSASPDAY